MTTSGLDESEQPKEGLSEQWRGEVEAVLPTTPAVAAWPHLARFCSIHLYMPGVDASEHVAGDKDRPGCVRYVVTYGPNGEAALWAREELLETDAAAMRLRYTVLDGNMGFGRYVATLSLVAAADDDEAAAACKISWAFDCEPVKGMSKEGLIGILQASVQGVAARIEALHAAAEKRLTVPLLN